MQGNVSSLILLFLNFWQAFARLSAVYGGTYMLNKPECKVNSVYLANNWIVA